MRRQNFVILVMLLSASCSHKAGFTYADGDGSSLSVDRANIASSGTDQALVTVSLKQAHGAALSGVLVQLSAPQCTVTPATAALTDSAGRISFALASAYPGQINVTATVQQATFTKALPQLQLSLNVYAPAVAGSRSVTVATPLHAQITARSADGSMNAGYQGVVHFSSSDPLASLPADYTMAAKDHGAVILSSGIILHTPGTAGGGRGGCRQWAGGEPADV